MKKLIFRVKYRFKDGDDKIETSRFLIDQQGSFYTQGTLQPITPCDYRDFESLSPLIKINNEYLSIEEIEKRLNG